MNKVHLTGKRRDILRKAIDELYPEWPQLITKVRGYVVPNKKEVWEEQACVMAYLASQYDHEDARFLELGANRGFTAAVMKLAAPQALMTTLEPDPERRKESRANVQDSLGVVVSSYQSTHYLVETKDSGVEYDLIFVDGDHKHIVKDLPWFNRLKVGGLFLHHDYSPLQSSRPCPPVFEALNDFGAHLGRQADVLVVESTGVGMAGWYRLEGESWPEPTDNDGI